MWLNNKKSGSIMIAALIMALITGSLVGLFLKTVSQEVAYAHRSRMMLQVISLAEAGIDTAIYALNKNEWSYWKAGANGYYRDTYSYQDGEDWLYISYSFRRERRNVKMYIESSIQNPKIVSEGIITLPDGTEISRQVFVELGTRSAWANGLLAKESLTFAGNGIEIDSYNSDFGLYEVGVNQYDNGSIATPSVITDAITVGNGDVFGSVSVGGNETDNANPPDVGPNGSIRGLDDPPKYVDLDRISYDFVADLPDPTYPTHSTWETTITDKTMGEFGQVTYIKLSSLEIKAQDVDSYDTKSETWDLGAYRVKGHVVLIVEGDVNISGELKLDVDTNFAVGDPGRYSSMEVYVAGDFIVDGNDASVFNELGRPQDVIVYGMGKDDPTTANDETPQIKLAGNGDFYGAVYAPNYDCKLGGGGVSGAMFGAVVAETITMGGGYHFSYDEALAGYDSGLGWKVLWWQELTDPTEKKNMVTILTDGL